MGIRIPRPDLRAAFRDHRRRIPARWRKPKSIPGDPSRPAPSGNTASNPPSARSAQTLSRHGNSNRRSYRGFARADERWRSRRVDPRWFRVTDATLRRDLATDERRAAARRAAVRRFVWRVLVRDALRSGLAPGVAVREREQLTIAIELLGSIRERAVAAPVRESARQHEGRKHRGNSSASTCFQCPRSCSFRTEWSNAASSLSMATVRGRDGA